MFHDVIMILLFLYAREHLYVYESCYVRDVLYPSFIYCLHAREHATVYRGNLRDVSSENNGLCTCMMLIEDASYLTKNRNILRFWHDVD